MTGDWTSGYVTEIGYQWGYFTELNPMRARIALLCNGITPPEVNTACELGFGQGVSMNIHAAASEMEWYGNDFNPSHAAVAREIARSSGAKCRVFDDSFAELRARNDLPEFDYIGLHGVWSWISDVNRQEIVDFVKDKLKIGGVLYVSYNVQPGWSNFIPLRNLMTEYVERITPSGKGISDRIGDALEFTEKFMATNPNYAQANPQAVKRLENTKTQNRNYLAHEYFNRDWHPMSFLDMSRWLDQAKLSYACSAHFFDQVPSLTMTKEQRECVNQIPDPMFRHQLTDFMTNQLFRRDYWVKGSRRLSASSQMECFSDSAVVLIRHIDDTALKVKGPVGEATMNEEVYKPLLDLLSDNKVRTISEIIEKLKDEKRTPATLLQALLVLMGDHQVAPATVKPSADIKRQCRLINEYIKGRSKDIDEVHFLASPVTGGGIPVSRINQLFILAREGKFNSDEELARYAWQRLSAQNQRMVQDGKPLETEEENLAELKKRAGDFLAKTQSVYAALGIQ